MKFVRHLSEIDRDSNAIAGGKGASLGEMLQAGIPVPPGFVVLSHAFTHFLNKTGIGQKISCLFTNADMKNLEEVKRTSSAIRSFFVVDIVPKEIILEIKKIFAELGAPLVAVRSSATAEDGVESAWAGQLESFLNTTSTNLIENVLKCWGSLFTPRAIRYRLQHCPNEDISVAVVVQKMVQSEQSGISFSTHPVTQEEAIVIEAGLGLGEAIVSGEISPDQFVVCKQSNFIIERDISLQKKLLQREGDKNEWVEIAEDLSQVQKLSDGNIKRLSKLVCSIEDHYGFPVDVEWAIENDNLFIVQSRPITTLG